MIKRDEYKPEVMYTLFGSHLYGLNNADSDEDWKGIYLPTHDELLLNQYPPSIKTSSGDQHSKNGAGDFDNEIMSLPRFIELACRSDTMAIDLLHADVHGVREHYPHINGMINLEKQMIWDMLVKERTRFYSKNMASLIGYLKHQAAKYGVKGSRMGSLKTVIEVYSQLAEEYGENAKLGLTFDWCPLDENCKLITVVNTKVKPNVTERYYEILGKKFQGTIKISQFLDAITKWYDNYGHRAKLAEANDGIDWKAVSHALRAGYQVIDIFEKGDFEYPLDQTEYLRNVKEGKLDFKSDVQLELERVTDRAMELSELSMLPEKVDTEYWDKWLLDMYEMYVI